MEWVRTSEGFRKPQRRLVIEGLEGRRYLSITFPGPAFEPPQRYEVTRDSHRLCRSPPGDECRPNHAVAVPFVNGPGGSPIGGVAINDHVLIDLGYNNQTGTLRGDGGDDRWHEIAMMLHFNNGDMRFLIGQMALRGVYLAYEDFFPDGGGRGGGSPGAR